MYSDYVSPSCYLADAEVGRLLREPGMRVDAAAFELRPPGTGPLSMDDPGMRQRWADIEPLAQQLGVRMQYPRFMTRTRKAHEAVAWARERGADRTLHEAVFRAYWQEGRDIGRIDVLMQLAGELGLDAMGLKVALDIDQYTGRVERDEAAAALLRLRDVPAYVLVASAPGETGAGEEQDDGRDGLAVAVRMGLQRFMELRDWVAGDNDV